MCKVLRSIPLEVPSVQRSVGNGRKWLVRGARMAASSVRRSAVRPQRPTAQLQEDDAENKELFWAFCQFAPVALVAFSASGAPLES